MLTNFIIQKFIKDSSNTQNIKVRNSYGKLAGTVGIMVNAILFTTKFTIGFLTSSIAITADAFNNLSDTASSIITIVGFKMASKPADKEHPFGHGRIEYISALIVAFLVMLVGLQFVKSSYERIINPTPITFEIIPFILLLISILLKFWLSKFNFKIGNTINSAAIKASATDAIGDVFTSSIVVFSFLLSKFTNFPLDAYMGMLVAFAIIYAGISLVKETISPLLGESPEPELVSKLTNKILAYDHVSGMHDLMIHNYGPGRIHASVHVEIPCDIDIITIHNIIDKAEREISKDLNLHLVIHMDPISIDTDEIIEARKTVQDILRNYPSIVSLHDFRIVGEGDIKNLIFDIVLSCECDPKIKGYKTDDELLQKIEDAIKLKHPLYNCIITIDYEYY